MIEVCSIVLVAVHLRCVLLVKLIWTVQQAHTLNWSGKLLRAPVNPSQETCCWHDRSSNVHPLPVLTYSSVNTALSEAASTGAVPVLPSVSGAANCSIVQPVQPCLFSSDGESWPTTPQNSCATADVCFKSAYSRVDASLPQKSAKEGHADEHVETECWTKFVCRISRLESRGISRCCGIEHD